MEVRDHPALRSSLITYLGNKRRLLPLVADGFAHLHHEIGSIDRVAEPFAGSGVVGRMARLAGCTVHSNDIEDYTRPFGRSFLEVQPEDVDPLFGGVGGYRAALDRLNALSEPNAASSRYFSRHYAPRATESANPDQERLFFTRENALRIDAMLEAIHGDDPLRTGDPALRRDILLASVLVEMSIHNNTSGVMKGFHRGWGGRGGDALSRIMAPVRLEPLPFIAGPRGTVTVGDATEVFADASLPAFDVAYLDPPYTIHQYGANYHLLTSAVRWDRYDPGPVAPGSRAGIRRDHLRSDFCRRGDRRAYRAFARTLDALRARALLVSYNTDGIIPAAELATLLSDDGANTLLLSSGEYHKFRGGKGTQQALHTTEHLYIVIRGRRQSAADRRRVFDQLHRVTLERTIRDTAILPDRWSAAGGTVTVLTTDGDRSTHEPRRAGSVRPRFRLSDSRGNTILLDRQYRVRAIENLPDPDHVVSLIDRSSAQKPEVCDALIAAGEIREAMAVLQSLKIQKYSVEFDHLAARIARRDLAPDDRTRLEALTARVRGRPVPPEGRSPATP